MLTWKRTAFIASYYEPEDYAGLVSLFVDTRSDEPASAQIDRHYAHGGGWRPISAFTMRPNTYIIQYPGDPPLRPMGVAQHNSELIIVYPDSMFAIVQPDGSFEVARLD